MGLSWGATKAKHAIAPRLPWPLKKQKPSLADQGQVVFIRNFGGATQSRTGLDGFAIRCITDLLSRRFFVTKKGSFWLPFLASGAGKESRTLDLNLGKVALYQLSYSRRFKGRSIANLGRASGPGVKNILGQARASMLDRIRQLNRRHHRIRACSHQGFVIG